MTLFIISIVAICTLTYIIYICYLHNIHICRQEEYDNCYSYAFNSINDYNQNPQPGDRSNSGRVRSTEYNCKNILTKVLADYKDVYKINDWESCKDDEYKIFLAVDDVGNRDYHFYKQNLDKTWSHKLGPNPITFTDASNNVVLNPLNSDRNYDNDGNESQFNYATGCGFLCKKL